MDICSVFLTKQAKRDLMKLPLHIVRKLQGWIDEVEYSGLSEARKITGYHDEPLKGKRLGQRWVRLSRSYRAIYIENRMGHLEVASVLEVNKHGY